MSHRETEKEREREKESGNTHAYTDLSLHGNSWSNSAESHITEQWDLPLSARR